MRAAIYARYSSENQRPESIEDQVAACRRLAGQRGFAVLEDHIYADQAQSGARRDRHGLTALVAAAQAGHFDAVLVDDLSRLARDNYLMLSVIAELHFEGVRVISVADGLDSDDEEATLGIQIPGIFNELQLRDLKKKTLRGQIGQKERGFSVGERTFGYRSVPVGTIRMQEVLERRTEQSAALLRELLGQVRLEPTTGYIGRPHYLARSLIDCLVQLKPPPGKAPDGGSSMLQQWRRRTCADRRGWRDTRPSGFNRE